MMMQGSARILVIDDDLDTVNLLRMVLQQVGHRVSTATSWEEVVDRLDFARRESYSFDVIILDIMMPDRSGFDMIDSLRASLCPAPPIIVLSARGGMEDMVKASEMGVAKYLTKPTKPEKLRQAVASVLSHDQGTRLF